MHLLIILITQYRIQIHAASIPLTTKRLQEGEKNNYIKGK